MRRKEEGGRANPAAKLDTSLGNGFIPSLIPLLLLDSEASNLVPLEDGGDRRVGEEEVELKDGE